MSTQMLFVDGIFLLSTQATKCKTKLHTDSFVCASIKLCTSKMRASKKKTHTCGLLQKPVNVKFPLLKVLMAFIRRERKIKGRPIAESYSPT